MPALKEGTLDRPRAGLSRVGRLLVLLVLASAVAAPSPAMDWLHGPLLADARQLVEGGDFVTARQRLEAVVMAHPEEVRARYALVQCELELAQLDAALATAEQAVAAHPESGYAHAALGDARLLLGDFTAAAVAYQSAVEVGPEVAAAHYGLAVVQISERRMRSARVEIETAYRLDGTDPRIVLAMASVTADGARRLALMRAALEGTYQLDAEERRAYSSRLAALARLGAEEGQCRLLGERRGYEVPLRRLHSAPRSRVRFGIALAANGGKKAVALLDSGASGVTLSESYARKLGLERLGESAVRGLGEEGLRPVSIVRLRTLELGGLVFEDCVVDVVASRHLSGDAMVGLADFASEFEITLDFGGAAMHLEPLPPLPRASDGSPDPYGYDRSLEKLSRGYVPVRIFGSDVLVPVMVDEAERADFLLDSGATDSILARRLARKVARIAPSGRRARGLSGEVRTVGEVSGVQLSIGGIARRGESLVVVDLDEYASRVGHGIGGLLGSSLLRDGVVVLDYRNAVAHIDLRPVRRRR